jgi:hypothetical protein
MKKIVATGFAILIGGISATAQNDNTKMVLPEFNAIVVSTNGDIKLNQGTENSVSVKTGNIQDAVSAEVKDNVLYLRKGNDDITVNVTKLNKLTLQSTCDVKSINQISSDKLEIFILGSSDVNLDVNVKELYTTIEGSGDAKYKGTANLHTVEVKGAGDLDAYDLVTDSTNIEISGAGDARVNATQDLKGVINGAGEITYFKEPVNKDIKVNGIGSYGLKGGKEESKGGDTTKIKIANKKVWIMNDYGSKGDTVKHKHKFDVYWAGFGLGINGYLNPNNGTKVPTGFDLDYAKSIDVTCNFWEQKIPLWKRHINIVTGMGFDFNNYRFSNNHYNLIKDSSHVAAVYDSAVTFKKNKLMVAYLDVPLLLQFDTDPIGKGHRTIHLSAGIVGSLKIGSHTKQEYEIGNTTYKPKIHDNFDLNPFKYSAMVRIGYGTLDLFATYALSPMFIKNEGPQVYPFSVGITLVGL